MLECEGVGLGFEERGCGASSEAVRSTEVGEGKKGGIVVVDDGGVGRGEGAAKEWAEAGGTGGLVAGSSIEEREGGEETEETVSEAEHGRWGVRVKLEEKAMRLERGAKEGTGELGLPKEEGWGGVCVV